MSLKLCLLASGSKGNCTYITDGKTAVLIDIGLSYRSLCAAAAKAKVDLNGVSAVINTHCHTDHCGGISGFLKKHDVPVYTHSDGKKPLIQSAHIEEKSVLSFGGSFSVGSLTVNPFELPHDAPVCCGFSVESGGKRVSIATDLGRAEDKILDYFYGSQISVIESNHDTQMLIGGRYPYSLKKRIMSGYGHLSNASCAEAAYKLISRGGGKIVLAHLSEENNLPELAFSTVTEYLKCRGAVEGRDYTVSVAFQRKPTEVLSAD